MSSSLKSSKIFAAVSREHQSDKFTNSMETMFAKFEQMVIFIGGDLNIDGLKTNMVKRNKGFIDTMHMSIMLIKM